jgi:hypothetical protein
MSSVYAQKLLRIHKLQRDIWVSTSFPASLCAAGTCSRQEEKGRYIWREILIMTINKYKREKEKAIKKK